MKRPKRTVASRVADLEKDAARYRNTRLPELEAEMKRYRKALRAIVSDRSATSPAYARGVASAALITLEWTK